MAKPTNYRGIHITVTYAMGYDYYEISQINKGKKWNDKTLFTTLKEAKMYIDEHYDELIKNESKKSARKSLKEDSLDDIIPIGHSEYFDTLVEFFKDNNVPIKISHTINGGKICYVENDMDFITVIFKSPKRGYELLKMIEMYGDGRTYLSKGKGGAWYSNHVPLEEVYVWDIDKDEFVNYKGKVLKNVDYDDIVESKKSVGKSLKEAQYYPTLNRGKGYDVLSWILLDIAEWGEKVIHRDCTIEDGHDGIIFRGRLYEYYIRTRYTDNLTSFDVKYDAWEDLCNDYMVSGFHDKGTPMEIQQLLHKKELWELIEVANLFLGKENIIELRPTRELVNWAERNYNYV